jgi:alkylation response protein AidB-like acyl-CoA dehydrogenase
MGHRSEAVAAVEWLRSARPELSALPLPGRGQTAQRWRCFMATGRRNLAWARLAEGHADAIAILTELGRPDLVGGGCWGVWAAEPHRLRAHCRGAAWTLTGEKRWCSGSSSLDRALVTATAEDGPRLFVVDPAMLEAVAGSWPAIGMAATMSETMSFDVEIPREHAVGEPGDYVSRPGFWHGAMGVAACWSGGTLAVADRLLASVRAGQRDDSAMRRALGRVRARLDTIAERLDVAADTIDRHPFVDPDELRERALSLRLTVEECARAVIDDVTVACGASALAYDDAFARAVTDLTLYIRQLDRHRDELELGAATERRAW